ncbi:thermonuclease family protein [Magnetococcus sp. PR-3]|uniref:thermonuclease family protein n=1 Tax=Magnetococcus sp. PR-3 TaxID=3120355 RepID=UPI002FCE0B6E
MVQTPKLLLSLLLSLFLWSTTMNSWADGRRLPLQAVPGAVVDGDTFTIFDVGRIRIMGIDTPEMESERNPAEPYALEAKKRAQYLLMNRGHSVKLTLEKKGRKRDVYKRPLCYVELPDGQDLGEVLLEEGLAIVYASGDLSRFKRYMKVERRARKAGVGAWEQGHWLIDHKEARGHVGAYRIVRGQIQKVIKKGKWIYLNFGKNWREDFTISISHRDWQAYFRKTLGSFKDLKNQKVEVRGRIGWRNGPLIRAHHISQLQLDK